MTLQRMAIFALVTLLLSPSPAGASFPGRNGDVVVSLDEGSDEELIRVSPTGLVKRTLTNNDVDDGYASWSSDGKKIVFVRGAGATSAATDDAPDTEIYSMRADGSRERRLTDNESGDTAPSWSPSGRRIAYQHGTGSAPSSNHVNGEIFIMKSDGSGKRRLTKNDVYDGEPVWSPNGRWILFVSARARETAGDLELYKMRPDGSRVTRLTSDQSDSREGDWSPNGRWVVFSRGKGERQLFKVRSDGTHYTRLTHSSLSTFSPTWSPNGKWIAFIGESSTELMKIRARGGDRQTVLGAGELSTPDWQAK